MVISTPTGLIAKTATTTKVIRKQKKPDCSVTHSKGAKDLEHIKSTLRILPFITANTLIYLRNQLIRAHCYGLLEIAQV